MLTDRMIKVCNMVGIPLLDHIIVSGDNKKYFSFKERGIMSNSVELYHTDYHTLKFELPVVAEKVMKKEGCQNNVKKIADNGKER